MFQLSRNMFTGYSMNSFGFNGEQDLDDVEEKYESRCFKIHNWLTLPS